MKTKQPTSLHNHQLEAYQSLKQTADVFFSRVWKHLPCRPRFSRFLAGPTGTGKSHLVRTLARELDVPVLELGATNWIPMGCSQRGAQPTWVDIAQFAGRNSEGIIFCDETDKLSGHSTWTQAIQVELFSAIDGRLPDTLLNIYEEAGEEDADFLWETVKVRLRDMFLVVGAGAFQGLAEVVPRRTCGFGAEEPEMAKREITKSEMAGVIPREITNRFVSPILYLPPLDREDYLAMLESAATAAPKGLAPHVRAIGMESIDEAIESQSGCRWVEEVMLAALIRSGWNPSPEEEKVAESRARTLPQSEWEPISPWE